MQTNFSTITLLSFYQWLDNYLLQNGQMYTNSSSQLYLQNDPKLGNGYVAYASPFRSFVWDSGVSGAIVFNSISGTANGIPISLSRGQSGMMTDFINGRVILPAGTIPTTAIISGSYAFKDLNLYFANQTQERMVFSQKYYLNSRFGNPATGIPPPYDMVTPCIFITNKKIDYEVVGLGGIYDSNMSVTLNVMAENLTQLEWVISLLAASRDVTFPQLSTNVWPLNNFGDYKSGYNYEIIDNQYGTSSNLFSIVNVHSSKMSDLTKIDQSIFVGEVNLSIQKARQLR